MQHILLPSTSSTNDVLMYVMHHWCRKCFLMLLLLEGKRKIRLRPWAAAASAATAGDSSVLLNFIYKPLLTVWKGCATGWSSERTVSAENMRTVLGSWRKSEQSVLRRIGYKYPMRMWNKTKRVCVYFKLCKHCVYFKATLPASINEFQSKLFYIFLEAHQFWSSNQTGSNSN